MIARPTKVRDGYNRAMAVGVEGEGKEEKEEEEQWIGGVRE